MYIYDESWWNEGRDEIRWNDGHVTTQRAIFGGVISRCWRPHGALSDVTVLSSSGNHRMVVQINEHILYDYCSKKGAWHIQVFDPPSCVHTHTQHESMVILLFLAGSFVYVCRNGRNSTLCEMGDISATPFSSLLAIWQRSKCIENAVYNLVIQIFLHTSIYILNVNHVPQRTNRVEKRKRE